MADHGKMTKKLRKRLSRAATSRLLQLLYHHVPITNTLRNYSQFDCISDFIAGITVGITLLPQSIAYAALAGQTPQCGLNSAFIGVFVYLFFGTVREVFIGPSSLMAILTYEYTKDLTNNHVILLAFICGCVELLISFSRLGFLVDLISEPVSSGFTAATSIIIIVSQLKGLLGIKYKATSFLDNFPKIIEMMWDVRVGDLTIGIIGIVLLLLLRKLKDYSSTKNKVFSKICWFLATSRNAIIVLVFSCITFYIKTITPQVPFKLSGKADGGLPRIKMPPFSTQMNNQTLTFKDMFRDLGAGVFIIPIVSILANISIAKAFANGGVVRATQEMFTLGMCNIANSFFQAMPSCGAFTRSAVASSSGVRTPVANLYAGVVVMLGLHFLSPFFQYIPVSTLSAVLICACIFLIEWKLIPLLWRTNKMNLFTLSVTFALSLCLGVEIGLLVGVICDSSYLIFLWARPNISFQLQENTLKPHILVTPSIGLFFPAVNYVYTKVNEIAIQKGLGRLPIVLNCANFSCVDYTAVKGLILLNKDFKERNQELIFVNVNENIKNFCSNLKGSLNFASNKIEEEEKLAEEPFLQIPHCEAPLITQLEKKDNRINKDECETLMLKIL